MDELPETAVEFFKTNTGTVPVLEGLQRLAEDGRLRVVAKCRARIERLGEVGHELRRPEADYLDRGIYELRIVHRRVHHRILYFFADGVAVLSHLLRKEGRVPRREIARAIRNRSAYESDPDKHTYER